jgi:hypothetical protein
MTFSGVRDLHWVGQGTPPAQDPAGLTDFGGVDTFVIDGDQHVLAGDFGELVITAASLGVTLRD